MTLQSSGEFRTFDSGAKRDIPKGKGRCDLMPLGTIAAILATEDGAMPKLISENLENIHQFIETGDRNYLYTTWQQFAMTVFNSIPTALLEVSIHYEEGAEKYGEHNWEKGIPAHSFIDSAVRHLIKYGRGDDDERHDRAFLWNILGLLWTLDNRPDYNDVTYVDRIQ